jgi:hypothetical protein
MERAVILLFLCLGSVLPAAGQSITVPSTETKPKEAPVTLSNDQSQAVIDAAVSAKSRQKTPKAFSPTLGAKVPKEVYLHAFRPEITQKVPFLKEYWYAFLDREVILVGGSKSKIAAVVDLPQELIVSEQPHQGAVEAKDREPAASVPSHTSPETIK